ncbi:hypothetical protein GIB67_025499, partial [Kingdonia uniflora]
VSYDDIWSVLSNAKQLLPKIESSNIKSGNVSISHLRTYLIIAADREDDITIAHAFILFMMGYLWFQTANDTVPPGYLTVVADLDESAQYDWCSAILASLYHGLDTAVTTGGAITGFSQLLMYWFYEYCGVGHPIVKEDVKLTAYPCLRAWERGNKKKTNDQGGNLFMLGRYHIDHCTIKTITWELWLDFVVSKIEDVLTAKLLSRKRMPHQVPNGNCEYYLGDRCWRQLTCEACIPLDPPLNMSPYISPATLQENSQRLQKLTDEAATLRSHLDSVDDHLYAHDLHLRSGRDVRVVPLSAGGGARTRQRRYGLRTRGGGTSCRGRGTGDNSEKI